MAYAYFSNIAITGISCAVPSNVVNNMEDISILSEAEKKKFIKNTGVVQKHVVSKCQTTSDLCFVATEDIISHKGYDKSDIDALIFITQTPDYIQPATSHVLHHRLGLKLDCMVFDVNLGCSGYTYGVHIASSLLQAKNLNKVLLLAGEVYPYNTNEKDLMLFGCAGTATILEKVQNNAESSGIHTLLKSDGRGYRDLIIPGGSNRNPVTNVDDYFKRTCPQMDGEAVFLFGITQVPKCIKEFFEIFGYSQESFDYFVFHQANITMLNHIAKKAKISIDKIPISIDRYGNTSSASVPLTIVDLCEKQEKGKILRLATSGFGIGLSWGVASFDIKTNDIMPMIITDDYYKEAYRG